MGTGRLDAASRITFNTNDHMAVIGTAIAGALGAFGDKPNIPDLPRVNATETQMQTVAGNRQVLPGAQALGADINRGNVAQT